VVFNNGLGRMFGVLESVEFVLGNAECLNEFYAAVWRVYGSEHWVVKKGKANNVRLRTCTDRAIGGDPMIFLKPFASFENIPGEVLQ
jgi:hypothetical protein